MAKPTKKTETKVTRITAADSTPAVKEKVKTKASKATVAKKTAVLEKLKKTGNKSNQTSTDELKKRKNPLASFWRYLKGSWHELRQVRWPDRAETWKMTGALLVFTLFFVVLILLMDSGFNQLFKLIMGK